MAVPKAVASAELRFEIMQRDGMAGLAMGAPELNLCPDLRELPHVFRPFGDHKGAGAGHGKHRIELECGLAGWYKSRTSCARRVSIGDEPLTQRPARASVFWARRVQMGSRLDVEGA